MVKYIIILCLYLTMPLMPQNALAASEQDARQFVDNVGKEVLSVVNASGTNKEQRQKHLQDMFLSNVDIDWMGQFVLGRSWHNATQDQRNRYIQAYRNYLLAHYTSHFANYTGADYDITDVKGEEEGQFTVNMKIKTPKESQDTSAAYRLRPAGNGQFKIVDIVIEGVSLIATERAEFAAVVQQKGMDGLITAIEAKTQAEHTS